MPGSPIQPRVRARIARWNGHVPLLMFTVSEPEDVRKPPSSSGLGHHPFKVVARVRIPLGVRIGGEGGEGGLA